MSWADDDEPLSPQAMRDLYRAVSCGGNLPVAAIIHGVYYVRRADGTVGAYPLLDRSHSMSKESVEKAIDTATRFVEQMRDDHRPMAVYTAMRAVLDAVAALKEGDAATTEPVPPKPAVDPVPTPPPTTPPPEATAKPATKH